jgi:hypothetical protein
MLADVLVSLALVTLLVVLLRLVDGRDVETPASESRFELGWPRGVQEEEPVRFRTELVAHRTEREARREPAAAKRPTTDAAGRGARVEPAFSARHAPTR